MKFTLNLNCYGIVINYQDGNKTAATITSDLTGSSKQADSALSGVESMVLALFCAGVDVSSPACLNAINAAVDAALNNSCSDTDAEGVITLCKQRRVSAIATEEITYHVDAHDWHCAVAEHESYEAALLALQRELKVSIIDNEADIKEIELEHDCEVTVI